MEVMYKEVEDGCVYVIGFLNWEFLCIIEVNEYVVSYGLMLLSFNSFNFSLVKVN